MSIVNDEVKVEPVVTEQELEKTLALLEGKDIKVSEHIPDPVVKVASLERPARESINALSSAPLRKALDISSSLDEIVALLGAHVDRSLISFQKSIQASANRDLAITQILKNFQKSLDENTALLSKMMELPSPSKSKLSISPSDVLEKTSLPSSSLSPSSSPLSSLSPQELRKSVTEGLEKLIRSVGANSSEGVRLVSSLVKFESTGIISDEDAQKALKL